jgi:hypothetical protein
MINSSDHRPVGLEIFDFAHVLCTADVRPLSCADLDWSV